jgi:hypothetical protein
MTKTQLKKALRASGMKDTNRAIADLFGIKEQAVQAWFPHSQIPELRLLQLQVKHSRLFKTKG